MMLKKWDDLPLEMRKDEILSYYKILKKKQVSLFLKRIFDIIMSLILIIILFPLLIILAILIKKDSKGEIIYKSTRITQYNKEFQIYKFRTMVKDADKIGSQVTVGNDNRITKIGKTLRKYRLDEIPQLFNILKGDMSFVGTRPESPYYVKHYTNEMYATLLLKAGVTSETSIEYKDEANLLRDETDTDKIYIEKILPEKMKYNLKSVRDFSLAKDIKTMIKTVIAVSK
ncbi:MAG: sugar transferase [Anaerococcus vaginalis]|nr:sugar transferase [Anaerococcus vaginalis]MDU5252046.1 sugar transferase [Anaerococcus vaginalis]MDU5560140.1 sugar transferase [Anaerococcus vaginalis]MDU5987956.1 sugar transferase [Anaerococcus vaginalis]MDU6781737.1 sugar transferase [Anaerococcus vaginalis]